MISNLECHISIDIVDTTHNPNCFVAYRIPNKCGSQIISAIFTLILWIPHTSPSVTMLPPEYQPNVAVKSRVPYFYWYCWYHTYTHHTHMCHKCWYLCLCCVLYSSLLLVCLRLTNQLTWFPIFIYLEDDALTPFCQKARDCCSHNIESSITAKPSV